MFLWSKKYLTNGVKLTKNLKLLYKLPKSLKKVTKPLGFMRKNLTNNNFKKPKIIFSKTSYKVNPVPYLGSYASKTRIPSILLNYYFNFKNRKLLTLNYNTLNNWYYLPFASLTLFSYTSHVNYFSTPLLKTINLSGLGFFTSLRTYVISVESVPGKSIKYATSWNSTARIINTNFKFLSLLLLLPSKKRKILSLFTRFMYYKRIPIFLNKLYDKNTYFKSKSFNKKPSVRGIAKNPTDHPHGGRTNTIRSPQTPWGYTAKNNK